MTVESIDNLIQLLMATICTIISGLWVLKSRKTEYILLLFFFLSATLGMSFWFLFQLIVKITPQVFCVSELSWITAYLFLVLFLEQLITREEKKQKHWLLLFPIVVGIVLMIYFCTKGEYFVNITWITIMIIASCISLRSLIYFKKQQKENNVKYQKLPMTGYFFILVLILINLEYLLWLVSCINQENTLSNPYFWIDFLITATFAPLLLIGRRAVES